MHRLILALFTFAVFASAAGFDYKTYPQLLTSEQIDEEVDAVRGFRQGVYSWEMIVAGYERLLYAGLPAWKKWIECETDLHPKNDFFRGRVQVWGVARYPRELIAAFLAFHEAAIEEHIEKHAEDREWCREWVEADIRSSIGNRFKRDRHLDYIKSKVRTIENAVRDSERGWIHRRGKALVAYTALERELKKWLPKGLPSPWVDDSEQQVHALRRMVDHWRKIERRFVEE